MRGKRQRRAKAHNRRRRLNKTWQRAEICGLQQGDELENIRLSVVMPFYRAGFIGWVPFESLIRQKHVDFPWELIVIEESFDNPMGYTRMEQYWHDLKKVNCVRLRYISLNRWMPLSAKWYYLVQQCDKQSKVVCFNSSDIYMSPGRLATQHRILTGSNSYNWHKLSGNVVYDISSDKHVRVVSMHKNRPDTCCRAATPELLRNLPLFSSRSGVDGKMYEALRPHGIRLYYDESGLTETTVNITGLNNISLNRGRRVENVAHPYRTCCRHLERHLPQEIVTRLRQCRKLIPHHRQLLRRTRKW